MTCLGNLYPPLTSRLSERGAATTDPKRKSVHRKENKAISKFWRQGVQRRWGQTHPLILYAKNPILGITSWAPTSGRCDRIGNCCESSGLRWMEPVNRCHGGASETDRKLGPNRVIWWKVLNLHRPIREKFLFQLCLTEWKLRQSNQPSTSQYGHVYVLWLLDTRKPRTQQGGFGRKREKDPNNGFDGGSHGSGLYPRGISSAQLPRPRICGSGLGRNEYFLHCSHFLSTVGRVGKTFTVKFIFIWRWSQYYMRSISSVG